ncbi:calcium-responsive transcription factor isoform X2 [Xenopus laevis]|uniref:Calcium-responsive transcription factor isoform X2 n=1 Tax=Xenopus laevis TaxID=8355 RepID=A0A8J0TVI4_XENLA|nr:calcium-responsive transcription factor isoform X2 [Xenopus laevis]
MWRGFICFSHMDMESNGLDADVLTRPADLLITCTNTEDDVGADDGILKNTANQISTLAEQYHFIDQSGNTIQYAIQAMPGANPQMMILTSESENGQVFHVIPSSQSGTTQLVIPQGQDLDEQLQQNENTENLQVVAGNTVTENAASFIIHSNASLAVSKMPSDRSPTELFQKPLQPLPTNIPVWARRLRSCEKIGDSYRGYCLSENELMSILALHKQQTQSVWGTRQSPSPAKAATRLMWKSQYVPYDGIPFVNAGSRAIVMECQYGPRRKGAQPKKITENDNMSGSMYKATCPARIYIKKVKKFPNYRVPTDPKIDKKLIRMEQEKAFNLLKKDLDGTDGVLRWYMQLPDQDAHQYHDLETGCFSPSTFQPPTEDEEEILCEENSTQLSRLHPKVAEKIHDLVSKGINEVYSVRKQLRKFVERDLFKPDDIPERHNLSYFPTVNDLKNHIHEAQKALGNEELIYDAETIPEPVREIQWTADSGNVLNEMVTVTFGPLQQEEQETLLKVENPPSEDVCQDTAQLISSLTSLQPKIFAQLQGLQLQPSFTSADGKTALITVNPLGPSFLPAEGKTALITVNPTDQSFTTSDGKTALITVNPTAPSFASADGTAALITVHPPAIGSSTCLLDSGGNRHPLVVSHLHGQQNDSPLSSITSLPASAHNLVSMGQIVTVEEASGMAGEVHQILLGDIHPIPIRIVENQQTIVEINAPNGFSTEDVVELNKEVSEVQLSAIQDSSTHSQTPV